MADNTFSLSDLKKIQEIVKDSALGTFIENWEKAGEKVGDFGTLMNKVGPEARSHLQSLAAALGDVEFFGMRAFTNIRKEFESFIDTQSRAGVSVGELATKAGVMSDLFLGFIPKAISGMGDFGKSGFDAGQTIADSFERSHSAFSKILGTRLTDFIGNFATATSTVYNLERGLIATSAAEGNLSSMMQDGVFDAKRMQESFEDLVSLTTSAARETGQTIESMMNLSQALRTIPDALTDQVRVSGVVTSQLVVTSEVATAFGQKQSKVAEDLTKAYTEFGIRGQDAFEMVAKLYTAAGDSKLRFDAFTDSVFSIAQNFKLLGDNTTAATQIVKSFDTAFKDSNLSPAGIESVIKGISQGVANLDIGTRAFISAQSGGPGGLQGAFKLELAIQEGKLNEVLAQTMSALQRQFGGEVLTLKQAATNPELAGEFLKQSQFVSQFLGVSEQQSFRVLEAMKTGVVDALRSGTGTGTDVLGEVVERGAREQERTTSVFQTIQRGFEEARLYQAETSETLKQQLDSLLGIQDSMRSFVGESGTRGVVGLASTPQAAAGVQGVQETFGQEAANTIQSFADAVLKLAKQYSASPTSRTENISTTRGITAGLGELAATPVGVSLPVPPEGLVTSLNTAPNTGGPGGFAPLHVEHDPLEVNVRVELGEPFNQKVNSIVRTQVREELGKKDKSQIRQAGTGLNTP